MADPAPPAPVGGAHRAPRVEARVLGAFVAIAALPVLVHLPVFDAMPGAGFVRRNSETFVMALVPFYWEFFARPLRLDGRGTAPRRRRRALQAAWVVVFLGLAVLLQGTSMDLWEPALDQRFITLGEGVLVVGLVSLYLGATRGVLLGRPRGGASLVPGSARVAVLVGLVLVVLFAYRPGSANVLGIGFVDWIRLNVEAVAGLVVVGLYVDAIAPYRGGHARLVRLGWYSMLLAVPLATQVGLLDGLVPEGLLDWIGRATEAFLAALFVSAWFDVRDGAWLPDR